MVKNIFSYLFIISFCYIQAFSQETRFERGNWQLQVGYGYDETQKKYQNLNEKVTDKGSYFNFSAARFWNNLGFNLSSRYTLNTSSGYFSRILSQTLSNDISIGFDETRVPLERFDLAIGPYLRIPIFKSRELINVGLDAGISLTDGDQFIPRSSASSLWSDPGFNNEYLKFLRPNASIAYKMTEQWHFGLSGHYAKYFNDNSILYTIDGVTQFPDKFGLSSLGFGLSITYLFGKTIVIPTPRVEEVELLPKNKNIEVKVIDRETDKSLKNVQIYLSNEQGLTLTGITDDNGLFTFKDMPKGEYKLYGLLNGIKTPIHEVFPIEFESFVETIQVLLEHHDPRFTLEGTAINKETNQPEGLVYIILNNTDKNTEDYTISDKKDGSFTYQLEPETDYTIYGRKNNFISDIDKITTKGLDRSKTLNYELYVILEEARLGKTINLENIYYDFDKATIREDASKDLLKLVQFLEDNPKLKIELNSHTDARGTAKYNDNLSQARADSVIKFLITKGINPNRLIAKGYGETKLVNGCEDGVNCTEAEHQQNRRTEFIVVE